MLKIQKIDKDTIYTWKPVVEISKGVKLQISFNHRENQLNMKNKSTNST